MEPSGKEKFSELESLLIELCKTLSDQISDVSVRFEASRLTLQTRDETLQSEYERKLRALRLVSHMRQSQNTSDLLKRIETERIRRLLDSPEGKPQ